MSRKKDVESEDAEDDVMSEGEMPVSDEITGPVTGPGKGKTNKSPLALEANFRVQANHSVERVDHWLANVEKALNSRKYPLSDEEQEKIMEHLNASFADFNARYEMKKRKDRTFKL